MRRRAAAMVKPVMTEIAVTAALLLILAFFMLKLDLKTETVEAGVFVIYGFACLFGGACVGKISEKRKFLTGLGYGLVYFLILLVLSAIAGRSPEWEGGRLIKAGFLCGFCGMAGGMFSGFLK